MSYWHDPGFWAEMNLKRELFQASSIRLFREAIEEEFYNRPRSFRWRSLPQIERILRRLSRSEGGSSGVTNATIFFTPRGGNLDLKDVDRAAEDGCLYLNRQIPQIVKPHYLELHLPVDREGNDAWAWSSLWLELDDIPLKISLPEGVQDAYKGQGYEPLCELSPGEYVTVEAWESGYYGHDDAGIERTLPDTARPAMRYLNGSILFVPKGGVYNLRWEWFDRSQSDGSLHGRLGREALHEFVGIGAAQEMRGT